MVAPRAARRRRGRASPSTTRKVNAHLRRRRQRLQETAEALDRRPARCRGGDRRRADLRRRRRHQRVRRPRRGGRHRRPRSTSAIGGRGRHPRHGHRRRRPATPSAAGASWRWPATTGSPPSGPCSASRRSCSASSRAVVARSGCPPPDRTGTGQGPDPDHGPAGEGRRGAAGSGCRRGRAARRQLHERAPGAGCRGAAPRARRKRRRWRKRAIDLAAGRRRCPMLWLSSGALFVDGVPAPRTARSACSSFLEHGPGRPQFTGR